MKKWTSINESLESSRVTSEYVSEDLSDIEASMAINEAIGLAAEARYISSGIVGDIKAFNIKAEENNYTCSQYIEESFAVGGIILAIIGLIVMVWKSISNTTKSVAKGFSDGLAKGIGDALFKVESLSDKIARLDLKVMPSIGTVKFRPVSPAALYFVFRTSFVGEFTHEKINGKDSLYKLMDDITMNFEMDNIFPEKGDKKNDVIKIINSELSAVMNTIGRGSKGSKGIFIECTKNKLYTKHLEEDTSIRLASMKDPAELIKNLKAHIIPEEKDIDAFKFIREFKAHKVYNDLISYVDSLNKLNQSYNKETMEIEIMIKKLEDMKYGLKTKIATHDTDENKEMIGILNKIHADVVDLQASISELLAQYCIPAFQLAKNGVLELSKTMNAIDEKFKSIKK